MNSLAILLQQVDIEEKIKNAPDKSYEIGVFIGTMLPFIILVALAYLIYRYKKKQKSKYDE
jgi:cytosine/uracil/thiamine/allantoin permease